ncbi:terminase small subunit [Cupriavidus gilardii]|uniref:Terminase small subunit n=1 Tax=Cupriavidus gilardii TaxID=82541 RepID=A0ABY4VNU2_9BURK|nr:terminase small subunit [Cupriavidus gilardii]USE78917.1 terminase small subunit [Cupriavidus gilardii]
MALTGKKQKFAEAKAKGLSNKDAAVAAGYSASSAAAQGSRLAKDPDVVAHLNRKTKAKAAKRTAPPAKVAPVEERRAPEPETLDEEAAIASFNWEQATRFSDPKAFLKAVMNDMETEPKLRVFAAKELMPYFHRKLGDTGKKEERKDAASKAACGRFAAAPPPLRAVK